MVIYQIKEFHKWAKKNKISKEKLIEAVKSIGDGSGTVDLGGGLYKVRIAKNKGKSSGYRTIIVHRKDFRSLFLHGFEKNEKANISSAELAFFKNYAEDFLNYPEEGIEKLMEMGDIFKLENEL
jgi:hypothetical protein